MGVLQTFVSEPSLVSWYTFKVFLKDYENRCLFVFSKKSCFVTDSEESLSCLRLFDC